MIGKGMNFYLKQVKMNHLKRLKKTLEVNCIINSIEVDDELRRDLIILIDKKLEELVLDVD